VAMAMAAIVAARRSRATPSRTFGLYRLEVLAALGNAVLLFGVAGWILYEAVERFVDPPAVSGLPVMLAAAAGLVANLVVFLLLRRGARESIRAGAPSGTDAAVALFHSLSDATRLAIVRRLAGGEARVADLVGELGLAQSTVSAHVGCLRDCGLVTGRPQGRQVFYSLVRPELLDLLRSAEALLAVTGERVALCPNYGIDAMRGRGTGDE
ncbi:MAG: metalloregulator ArsR/SmtB family transcription factor, partial [Pseudonocardiaceae bacterium]